MQAHAPMGVDDEGLARLIGLEVERDGGTSELSVLPSYNRKIRRLLGDRKIGRFVSAMPLRFAVAKSESGVISKVRLVHDTSWLRQHDHTVHAVVIPTSWCTSCGAGFQSRNRLFKHIKAGCSTEKVAASSANATPGAKGSAAALVKAVQGVLCNPRSGSLGAHVPLSWVVSPAKPKAALRRYVRECGALAVAARQDPRKAAAGELVPFRPDWWVVAMQQLHALLSGKPHLFVLLTPSITEPEPEPEPEPDHSSPLSGMQLRATTLALQPEAWPNAEADAAAATAIAARVLEMLRWQARDRRSPGQVSLGVLARDPGVQNLLGARALLPLLQAQAEKDGRLSLAQHEVKGWSARLTEKWRPQARDTSVAVDAADSSSSQKLCPKVMLRTTNVIVLSKPSGVTTEALVDWLQRQPCVPADYRVCSVSRLDRGTSGAIVMPLSAAAEEALTAQFKARTVLKVYTALCHGVTPLSGSCDTRLRTRTVGRGSKTTAHPQGRHALTNYERVHAFCDEGGTAFSLVEVEPKTGRTHQIRAHMAMLSNPLVGDKKYGGRAGSGADLGIRRGCYPATLTLVSLA